MAKALAYPPPHQLRTSMTLPLNKTKIVCTIGPASRSRDVMEELLLAGMNVARLNFSHGDFTGHKEVIEDLRAAARVTGRRLAIMADLPGPKMRIGKFDSEPIDLKPGDLFTLTTDDLVGDAHRVSVTFTRLPQVVAPGDTLYLNDGLLQVDVEQVQGSDHGNADAGIHDQQPASHPRRGNRCGQCDPRWDRLHNALR